MRHTKIEGIVNPDGSPGFAWNPFVGCLNNCRLNQPIHLQPGESYCWARKCLARSKCELCRSFTPHWHAERMEQPYTLKKPSTIAVCWTGDVWRHGAEDWPGGNHGQPIPPSTIPCLPSGLISIMEVFNHHTYLCLTRDPRGYYEPLALWGMNTGKHYTFPENVWLGVTVTCQEDVDRIGPDFAGIDHPNKFISYEPMLGEIKDWGKLGRFGWLYMGALTDGRGRVKMEPDLSWLVSARRVAYDCGAKVWEKNSLAYVAAENMVELGGLELRKETPWTKEGKT